MFDTRVRVSEEISRETTGEGVVHLQWRPQPRTWGHLQGQKQLWSRADQRLKIKLCVWDGKRDLEDFQGDLETRQL